MFVSRAFVHPEHLAVVSTTAWPFTMPCVRELVEGGLEFGAPVTFLVGENGSGKSTIVEGLAGAYGLDARGDKAGRKYASNQPKTPLGELLTLDLTLDGLAMRARSRLKQRGFFLRAETAFDFLRAVGGSPGYWTADVSTMSHGEGFMTVFDAMFAEPGFYLMDEPEAALSFTSCLQLVAVLHALGRTGAQVVCATHSPVLAATPGADVVELGEHGFRRTSWAELALVDHWRGYLDDPQRYLHHLIGEAPD